MKSKYWDINPILSKQALYNMIFGERSNGKTYGVLQHGLEEYFKNGSEIAVIRRWAEDFKNKNGSQMFTALVNNGVVTKLSKGKYNNIIYNASRWYLAHINPDDEKDKIINPNPFAYAFSIASNEHYKSTSYPNIRTVLFDEFLTRNGYLPDEFIQFQNVLSTIIRERNNVTIFMLGNTVNKYSPYFDEMGLSNVKKMKKGTIDVYTYGDSGLTVAVEYSDFPAKEKKSDIYFAFNNPKLQMITKGEWEINVYPHLPVKYTPNEIIYMYFIKFDNELLQCEIICKENSVFTYIHRKTTDIKDTDTAIIYQQEHNPKPNYKRRITKPTSELEKKITSFFIMDKVFYQDNTVGEVVRNYLQWCKTATE